MFFRQDKIYVYENKVVLFCTKLSKENDGEKNLENKFFDFRHRTTPLLFLRCFLPTAHPRFLDPTKHRRFAASPLTSILSTTPQLIPSDFSFNTSKSK